MEKITDEKLLIQIYTRMITVKKLEHLFYYTRIPGFHSINYKKYPLGRCFTSNSCDYIHENGISIYKKYGIFEFYYSNDYIVKTNSPERYNITIKHNKKTIASIKIHKLRVFYHPKYIMLFDEASHHFNLHFVTRNTYKCIQMFDCREKNMKLAYNATMQCIVCKKCTESSYYIINEEGTILDLIRDVGS